MGTKFGGNYPVHFSGRRKGRLLFIAAAGFSLSFLILILLALNFRQAEANTRLGGDRTGQALVSGTVHLFVPGKLIRAGSKLAESGFQRVPWPRESVPSEAIMDLKELQGTYARVDIPSMVPVLRSHVTRENQEQVTLPITPGMRAVTIQVDAESSVDFFARPGVRVDVVLTLNSKEELKSIVLVQNAKILSAGGDMKAEQGSGRGRKTTPIATVTLEVSPADALKIATSKPLGSMSLLLRAADDEKAAAVVEVTKHQIDGGAVSDKDARRHCNNGVMRIDGKEYIIDCDGSITPVDNSLDP